MPPGLAVIREAKNYKRISIAVIREAKNYKRISIDSQLSP